LQTRPTPYIFSYTKLSEMNLKEKKQSTVEVYVATCSMSWFPKVVAVDFIGGDYS